MFRLIGSWREFQSERRMIVVCGVTNWWLVHGVTFRAFRAVSHRQPREVLAPPEWRAVIEDEGMDGWTDVLEGVGWLDRNFPATYVHLDVQHDPLVLLYMDAPDTVLAFVIGLGPVRRQNHSGWICNLATTHSCTRQEKETHMQGTLRSCLQIKVADCSPG